MSFETALWRAWRRPRRLKAPDDNAARLDIVGRFACADDVILLTLAHDVRPLVERASAMEAPVARPVHLVFRRVRGTAPAKIFEVPAPTFALLQKTKIEPIAAEHLFVEPGLDRATLKTLISLGILESAL